MSTPVKNEETLCGSPTTGHFIPFPLITRRNRTFSQSEKAAKGPDFQGTVKSFCRQKGHGFIAPTSGEDPIFVHVHDIDGEYVPHQGDIVEYKTILCPPKMIKLQAVHVKIVNFSPGRHETWDEPMKKEG